MILFQLTLSGQMIRSMLAIKYQVPKPEIPNFVASVAALKRERLIACGADERYRLTQKGELALQIAAMDLQDFVEEVASQAALDRPRGAGGNLAHGTPQR